MAGKGLIARRHFVGYLTILAGALILFPPRALSTEPKRQIIAYYFHTSIRCRTCLLIEDRAENILRWEFADMFRDSTIQWRAINVQLAENRYYLNDLYVRPKSLVLVEYRDGAPQKRRTLKQVWKLIHNEDPSVFNKYVTEETRGFIEEDTLPP